MAGLTEFRGSEQVHLMRSAFHGFQNDVATSRRGAGTAARVYYYLGTAWAETG